MYIIIIIIIITVIINIIISCQVWNTVFSDLSRF